jgi:hypothetical protein
MYSSFVHRLLYQHLSEYSIDKDIDRLCVAFSKRVAISPFLPILILLKSDYKPLSIISFCTEFHAVAQMSIENYSLYHSKFLHLNHLSYGKTKKNIYCAKLSPNSIDDYFSLCILPYFSVHVISMKEMGFFLETPYNSYKTLYVVCLMCSAVQY